MGILYCRHFWGIEDMKLSKDCVMLITEDKLIVDAKYEYPYNRIVRFETFKDDGIEHFRFYYLDEYDLENEVDFIFTRDNIKQQLHRHKIINEIKNKCHSA